MNRLAAWGLALTVCGLLGGNWPQWRGPEGNGVAAEKNLPIIWNETRNVRWKCPLPEWGTSTPAIWGDAVFVTAHTDDGELVVVRIDKRTGDLVWKTTVARADPPRRADKSQRGGQTFHRWHNLASPSPVTDGEHLVVHFGQGELAGLDFDGRVRWQRNLQKDYGRYTIWWGHANSPILHDGLVISVCMQDSLTDVSEPPAASYVVAHDVRDGHVKWHRPRVTSAKAEECDAYTTPLWTSVGGQSQVIVMGANQLDGYEPATGKPLWHLPNLIGGRTVTSPIAADGTIYCTRGMRKPLLAVKMGGAGELPRSDIRWTYELGTPDSASPVLWNNLLFFVADDGIARCLSAEHGTLHWKERLPGEYKASPMVAQGRIFFLNTTGLCTVISAAPRFDKLTSNQLDDETLASPAVSDGRIFLRGKKRLYCVGLPPQ